MIGGEDPWVASSETGQQSWFLFFKGTLFSWFDIWSDLVVLGGEPVAGCEADISARCWESGASRTFVIWEVIPFQWSRALNRIGRNRVIDPEQNPSKTFPSIANGLRSYVRTWFTRGIRKCLCQTALPHSTIATFSLEVNYETLHISYSRRINKH